MGEPNFDGKYHSSRAWYVGGKDGEIETIGKKDDAAVTDPTLSASEIALLKGLVKILSDVWDDASNTTKVTLQQVEGAIDSAVPTRAAFVGGKYSLADPTYHDGDLTPVRTNAKGEVLTQLMGSKAGKESSATFTRPNDTNDYAALDVISDSTSSPTVMTFSNVLANAGGMFAILSAKLEIDVSAVPSGTSGFRLHLYDTSPTAINDNSPYNLPSGDRAKHLGAILLNNPSDYGDTIWSDTEGINFVRKLAEGSTTLYGILVTIGAYTPTALAIKKVTIYTMPM